MLILQSRNSVCLPQRLSNQTASTKLVRMDILLRLEYNPTVLMSGAIARAEHAKQDSAQLFIKGAPFEVAALVGFAALPQGWGAVRVTYSLHVSLPLAPPPHPLQCPPLSLPPPPHSCRPCNIPAFSCPSTRLGSSKSHLYPVIFLLPPALAFCRDKSGCRQLVSYWHLILCVLSCVFRTRPASGGTNCTVWHLHANHSATSEVSPSTTRGS